MLVFVAAERRELGGLLDHAEGVRNPKWPVDFARLGRLNGRDVAMLANGPGPVLAGRAVDVAKEYLEMGIGMGSGIGMDGLVSVGFCGGLNRSLQPCDIFAATEVMDVGPALLPISARSFHAGKLCSMDRVVFSVKEKNGLDGDAVEMEATAVAGRARQWNLPFYAVRVVTDAVWEELPLDFNRMRSSDGHFSRARIIAAALRRPATLFPELMRMNRRTKRAAKALGDFLADARF